MKTIKTKLTQTGANLYIKALIAGSVTGGLSITILLCLLSVILLISGKLPIELLPWLGLAIGCVASLISGYTCAVITKINGMIIGFCGGFIVFFILFISGIVQNEMLTLFTLTKLVLYTLCGAVGGIKGVNKKDKIHIK